MNKKIVVCILVGGGVSMELKNKFGGGGGCSYGIKN